MGDSDSPYTNSSFDLSQNRLTERFLKRDDNSNSCAHSQLLERKETRMYDFYTSRTSLVGKRRQSILGISSLDDESVSLHQSIYDGDYDEEDRLYLDEFVISRKSWFYRIFRFIKIIVVIISF